MTAIEKLAVMGATYASAKGEVENFVESYFGKYQVHSIDLVPAAEVAVGGFAYRWCYNC
jgi:hypothetical protein